MHRLALWLVVIIVALLLIMGIFKYNKMAAYDEGLEKAWNPLLNVLVPRYEEVPPIVDFVVMYNNGGNADTKALTDGYKLFKEAEGFKAKAKAADDLEVKITDFILQAQTKYPGIASHYQFVALQQDFEKSTHDMQPLASAYNDVVVEYNTYVRQFPNNIIAMILGFPSDTTYFGRDE
jgi:LemA protein